MLSTSPASTIAAKAGSMGILAVCGISNCFAVSVTFEFPKTSISFPQSGHLRYDMFSATPIMGTSIIFAIFTALATIIETKS